jgi:hypothetical protein
MLYFPLLPGKPEKIKPHLSFEKWGFLNPSHNLPPGKGIEGRISIRLIAK